MLKRYLSCCKVNLSNRDIKILLLPCGVFRVLSDWLEVKFGGREGSEVKEKLTDGTLQNLCVTNTLQENGRRTHKVHISVKVWPTPHLA